MSNVIEFKNVCKTYSGFALNDISFELKKGYIMGFIGANGAGKTTTIKLLMNLLKKESGEIKLFGLDHVKDEVEIKQKIGFVYEDCYLYQHLTLAKMKNMIAPFYKNWNEDKFQNLVKKFNLPLKKKISELSKGNKVKYSIALAFSHEAELLILDEPTSGVDPMFRDEFKDLLREEIQNENKAIFYSTHITADLEQVADYITFIHDGKIVFSRSKDEILENYALVKGDNSILTPDNRHLFVGIKAGNYGFEAITANTKLVENEFGGKIVLEKATLDDVMIFTAKGN